jgi:hypothetical protein
MTHKCIVRDRSYNACCWNGKTRSGHSLKSRKSSDRTTSVSLRLFIIDWLQKLNLAN